jgi:hypothetical protein
MYQSYQYDIMSPISEGQEMSLIRPLDPNFPIDRQLGVDATPLVLVNVFTPDKADKQALPRRLATGGTRRDHHDVRSHDGDGLMRKGRFRRNKVAKD